MSGRPETTDEDPGYDEGLRHGRKDAYAAQELAAAYVARQDTLARLQHERAEGRVPHAHPPSVRAILAAEDRLVAAELAYREAVGVPRWTP